MFNYFFTIKTESISMLNAIPPTYTSESELIPIILSGSIFALIGIASLLPWKKYDAFKRNAIASYSCVLIIRHFSITNTFLKVLTQVIPSFIFYILLYIGLMLANTNKIVLKTTSLIAFGYLIACQTSVYLRMTFLFMFIICALGGLLISLILQRLDKDNKKVLTVLFSSWLLFCSLDTFLGNKLSRLLLSTKWYLTLIPRVILLASLLSTIVYTRYKK